MFGRKRLKTRIGALEVSTTMDRDWFEKRLQAAEERLGARIDEVLARVTGEPDQRLRLLLNSAAEDLRGGLARALEQIQQADAVAQSTEARARGDGEHQPREWLELGKTYRAAFTGHIALSRDSSGGTFEKVALYVGPTDPPERLVCRLATREEINFVSCIVRRGEYWRAISEEGVGVSVRYIFTPFL